jgi:hypothetical protein
VKMERILEAIERAYPRAETVGAKERG